MSDPDFDRVADIADVIEQAGGSVKDVEVKEARPGGIFGQMKAAMGGGHHHYLMEVCLSGPTTRDVPDIDEGLDVDDALRAVAVAKFWAEREELDELTSDLDDVGNRIGSLSAGFNHPSEEMSDFRGVDPDD